MRTRPGIRTTWRIGLVVGVAAASIAGFAAPAFAADALTVTPARGPSGGGNTIAVTTAGAAFTTTPPSVAFSYNACPASWPATTAPAAAATSPFALTAGFVKAATVAINSGNGKQLDVTVPSALALTSTQSSSAWFVCVYPAGQTTAAASTALLIANTAAAAYTIVPSLSLSQNSGPSGAATVVGATVSSGSISTSGIGVELQYVGSGAAAMCALTYATPAAIAVTSGTQTAGVLAVAATSVAQPVGSTTRLNLTMPTALALTGGQTTAPYNICVYNGTSGSSNLIAQTVTPYTVAGSSMTLNTNQGPSGGGNTLTATSTAMFSAGVAAQFQYKGTGAAGACSPTFANTATAAVTSGAQTAGVYNGAVRVLGTNKVAITAPNASPGPALALASGQTTADYNVCVYSGTTVGTSALIAGTMMPYTIAGVSVIASVTPTTGSAQGGSKITVTGTNFPATLTAAIGGVAVTDVQVAANGQSFTGTAPAHSVGGPFALSVTTAAGTFSKAAAFTYTNGINIEPNFAPSNRLSGADITVIGTGFTGLDFAATDGSTPRSADAHVYLVDGIYNPAGTTTKANGEVAECVNVLVIEDNELICQLSLATSLNASGVFATKPTRTLTIDVDLNDATITATTGTFSATDVGMPISVPSNTQFAASQTIVSVTDATHAEISTSTTTAGSGIVATIGPRVDITSVTVGSGSTTISATNGTFSSSDVGQVITSPSGTQRFMAGTIITSVATNGSSATLSQPAISSSSSATVSIQPSVVVPDGTYTLTIVSSGAIGAQTDTAFSKSVVSNGSTFTVADY